MQRIPIELGPFGPVISGETGQWLEALKFMHLHNVLVTEYGTPHGVPGNMPHPNVGQPTLLLTSGQMVPASDVNSSVGRNEVYALAWPGYALWAPLTRPMSATEIQEEDTSGQLPQSIVWDLPLYSAHNSVAIQLEPFGTLRVGTAGISDTSYADEIFAHGEATLPVVVIVYYPREKALELATDGFRYRVGGLEAAPSVVMDGAVMAGMETRVTGVEIFSLLAALPTLALPGAVFSDEKVEFLVPVRGLDFEVEVEVPDPETGVAVPEEVSLVETYMLAKEAQATVFAANSRIQTAMDEMRTALEERVSMEQLQGLLGEHRIILDQIVDQLTDVNTQLSELDSRLETLEQDEP